MFGLFKSPAHSDPELGPFTRSRGMWRGSVRLPGLAPTSLVLSGTKSEPDSLALAAAKQLPAVFPEWLPAIESALHKHYRPYAEAVAAGEAPPPEAALPLLAGPNQVWPHAELQFVAVSPLDGTMTVELGYTVAWDEEHTLGARFQQGRFFELNGSVLPP